MLGEYEATGESVRIPIADLRPRDESAGPPELRDDIFSIPEKAWAKAEYRFSILEDRGNLAVVEKVSKDKKTVGLPFTVG